MHLRLSQVVAEAPALQRASSMLTSWACGPHGRMIRDSWAGFSAAAHPPSNGLTRRPSRGGASVRPPSIRGDSGEPAAGDTLRGRRRVRLTAA